MPAPTGFATPQLDAPFDATAELSVCVPQAQIRGMFFDDVLQQLKAAGIAPPDKRFVAFTHYPQREFFEFLIDSAQKLFPSLPPRRALHRLGTRAYPTFAESLIGRVIFGVLGNSVERVLRVAPRGYDAAVTYAKVRVVDVGTNHAHIRLDNVFFFDTYTIGVWEGAVIACGRTPTIAIRRDTPTSGELWMEWT